MNVAKIIKRLGGTKEVVRLTGLTPGRIGHWRQENRITPAWEKYLRAVNPQAFEPERKSPPNGKARPRASAA